MSVQSGAFLLIFACFCVFYAFLCELFLGERQGIAQKGVRAIEARKPQLETGQVLQKQPSARALGLSTNQ